MRIDANVIMTVDRWESDDYVIFEDDDGSFIAAQINSDGRGGWYFGMNSSHDLWFRTYASARKFLKEESLVILPFKKVKGST